MSSLDEYVEKSVQAITGQVRDMEGQEKIIGTEPRAELNRNASSITNIQNCDNKEQRVSQQRIFDLVRDILIRIAKKNQKCDSEFNTIEEFENLKEGSRVK